MASTIFVCQAVLRARDMDVIHLKVTEFFLVSVDGVVQVVGASTESFCEDVHRAAVV